MLHCDLFEIFGYDPDVTTLNAGSIVLAEPGPNAWEAAARGAELHQCAPMFLDRLRELQLLDAVPASIVSRLTRSARVTAARNLRGTQQLVELTARLQGRAPVIALKGASLMRTCYRDLSLRPMLDLDVLARESDLDILRKTLREIGYEHSPRTDHSLFEPKHQDPPYIRTGPSAIELDRPIELHRRLLENDTPFKIDPEALWSRAVPSESTAGLFYLSPEDQLLHICLHAGYHHHLDIGLYAFIDIAAIARNPDLDWARALERAQQWQAERCVFLMLQMARTLVRAQIPDAVLTALRPVDFQIDVERRASAVIYNRRSRGYEPAAFLSQIVSEVSVFGGWREIPGRIRRRLLRSPELRMRWPNSPHGTTWCGQFAPLLAGLVGLATRRRDREHLRSRLDSARLQRWMTPIA